METFIKLIGLAWLTNMVCWAASPIQVVKEWLKLDEESWKVCDWNPIWKIQNLLIQLWNCPKCLGFWLGLGWAGLGCDWLGMLCYASFTSLLAYLGEFAKALPTPRKLY